MSNTKIQWATKVWNPVTGCTKISEGCKNCYAEKFAKRMKHHPNKKIADKYFYGFNPFCHPESLSEPYLWKKPQRVFVCSMGDLFHENISFDFIDRVMATIALNSEHIFMVLTKRPERMFKYFLERESQRTFLDNEFYNKSSHDKIYEIACKIRNVKTVFDLPIKTDWPINNLWLGVTAENQQMFDERVPILLLIPAAIHFVSIEPMLGPVDTYRTFVVPLFDGKDIPTYSLDWIICGGETGQNARPMHSDWVKALRDRCMITKKPFFFKQWGEYIPWEPVHGENKRVWFPGVHNNPFTKIGKKKAGCLIDDQEVKQFPTYNFKL